MKKISVVKLVEMIDNGDIYITDSQRAISPVASIAQRLIFSLRTTKIVLDTPEFKDCESYIFNSDIKLGQLDGKYYILNDASEIMTLYGLMKGQVIKNGYVCKRAKMVSYFKRISKGEKQMTYDNLPVSMQKKLQKLDVICDIEGANSMSNMITARREYYNGHSLKEKVMITNEYTTFYSMFSELASAIRYNKRKGVLPSFYEEMSMVAQRAFKAIAENITRTNLNEDNVLYMLLLSIDAANFNDRKELITPVDTYNFICAKHAEDSRSKCLNTIENTLANLSIATKLLDEARLSHPMLWIGCAYVFGQYSRVSYIRKADRHALTRLTDAEIRSKRAKFNECIEQCYTGRKSSFDGTDIKICIDINGEGVIFNHATVDENIHSVSNLMTTTRVIKAIYNEI